MTTKPGHRATSQAVLPTRSWRASLLPHLLQGQVASQPQHPPVLLGRYVGSVHVGVAVAGGPARPPAPPRPAGSPEAVRPGASAVATAAPHACSHSSPVGRPRRSRATSDRRQLVAAPSPSSASAAGDTATRCRSRTLTSTRRPGATRSSSAAVGSRRCGQVCGGAFQNTSHGDLASAATAVRIAASAAGRSGQPMPSVPWEPRR